jgi:hypothetical protein
MPETNCRLEDSLINLAVLFAWPDGSALGTKTTQQRKVMVGLCLRNLKYWDAEDIICDGSFTVILAKSHCISCGAPHVIRAATCRRMPSLGVSSLDSGRPSGRPPFSRKTAFYRMLAEARRSSHQFSGLSLIKFCGNSRPPFVIATETPGKPGARAELMGS